MFHWEADNSLMAAIFLLVIGSIVGSWIAASFAGHGMMRSRRTFKNPTFRRKFIGMLAAFMAICYAIVGLITTVGSLAYTASETGDSRQATAYFGLESDRSYPLVMGSRVGGSSVEADADGGFFSAHASVTSQPASAISVAFTHQDKSYILEVPVSKITFVQSSSKEPTVSMHINRVPDSDFTTEYTIHGRDWHLHNLFIVSLEKGTTSEFIVSDGAERRGLAPLINAYLESATVTLTPEMYMAILGTP